MIAIILVTLLTIGVLVGTLFGAFHLRGERKRDRIRVYIHKETGAKITNDQYEYMNYTEKGSYEGKTVESSPYWTGWGNKAFIIVLTTLLAPLFILFAMFASVGPNEVGIIYDQLNGGVLEETYGQGLHIKSPFRTVTNISTSNRTKTILDVSGQTSDNNYIDYNLTIIYRIDKDDAGRFFRAVNGADIQDAQLMTELVLVINEYTTQKEALDLLGSDYSNARTAFFNELQERLDAQYSVTLVSLSIDLAYGSPEIEAIVQQIAKAKAEQRLAEEEQARQAIINKTNKEKAEADAIVALTQAANANQISLEKAQNDLLVAEKNAEAQAKLNAVAVTAINFMYEQQFGDDLAAKEEFEANGKGGYLTIQQIDAIVMKQLYYDTWDGELPGVITDGAGIILTP